MVLRNVCFSIGKKRVSVNVKICSSLWSKFSGLMFRTRSPALLFVFSKEKNLSIHSFFCVPFIAVWLNERKIPTKICKIDRWKPNFSGKGKYLLEIPCNDENYLKMTNLLKNLDEKE